MNPFAQHRNDYATIADFSRVFIEEMADLHQLASLLTKDPEKAERCFVASLENTLEAKHIFKRCALSWAKSMVIQNAIRALNPRPLERGSRNPATNQACDAIRVSSVHFELHRVLELEAFDRFVYVMSVLEGYSDKHCALLLGYSLQEIREARVRALTQMAAAAHGAPSSQDSIRKLSVAA